MFPPSYFTRSYWPGRYWPPPQQCWPEADAVGGGWSKQSPRAGAWSAAAGVVDNWIKTLKRFCG